MIGQIIQGSNFRFSATEFLKIDSYSEPDSVVINFIK